jgi:hypothetical protein
MTGERPQIDRSARPAGIEGRLALRSIDAVDKVGLTVRITSTAV